MARTKEIDCPTCNGTGKVSDPDDPEHEIDCTACDGTGKVEIPDVDPIEPTSETVDELVDNIINVIKDSSDPLMTMANEIDDYLNNHVTVEFAWIGVTQTTPPTKDPTTTGTIALNKCKIPLKKELVTSAADISGCTTQAELALVTNAIKGVITGAIKTGTGLLSPDAADIEWELTGAVATAGAYSSNDYSAVYFKKVDVTPDSDMGEVQRDTIKGLVQNLFTVLYTMIGFTLVGTHVSGNASGTGIVLTLKIE